jgi:glc operon protein GlcG
MMKRSMMAAAFSARAIIATAVLLAGPACWGVDRAGAQEAKHAATVPREAKSHSKVRDSAKLFEPAAITAAQQELERIERETYVATIIETVETVGSRTIEEQAHREAERSGIHGIYALIAKKERAIEVLVSRGYQGALTPPRQEAIRAAFIDAFRRGVFDDGLKQGVAAIGAALAAAERAGELPLGEQVPAHSENGNAAAAPAGTAGPLVLRNQVRLTLAGARSVIAGAAAKARSMQLKVNIAVVDDGGHLIAFERMDGARPASGYTAITKATTAATFRQPTGPLPAGAANPDPLLNLSLQNAAQASGGKITTLLGGVPAVVDGQVIGAVGVGGGTGEQDAQIARAGIQLLVDQLSAGQVAPRTPGAAQNTR